MTEIQCPASNESPTWDTLEFLIWKIGPEKIGGGKTYIQGFKDAWISHNKTHINSNASKYQFPPELLAGVCWIEVGGDPSFIDSVAFNVRAFDWSGPDWVDRNMTITRNPNRTSFGAVSMQLGTAAHAMGLDIKNMSSQQVRGLANCLQKDVFNIELVARHLRQLIDQDKLQKNPPSLDFEAVKIAGARYNRGMGLSLAQIKENTSYGNFIVKFWPRFSGLI
jgi:hypothetical protein